MIKPEDFEFHFTPDSHRQWVETIALPLGIPEAKINGGAYIVTRPVMGVCACDISIYDRITDLWEEALYIDNQQHLPCPKSLLEFSLPNGLSFQVIEPLKHYHLKYQGIDETHFDLEYFALHEPFDINDPEMDPMAAARHGPAWDTGWSGHYEATYKIKGDLTVRGKHYKVDTVDTGDRSWGPRPEQDNASVIWWHASIGEGLTVHVLAGHDLSKTDAIGPHISGYVMEDGKNYGIVACEGTQDYRKSVPMGGILEVTDIRGKKFKFTYSAMTSCYWAPYPSNTYLQVYMRVNHDGKIGHGTQQLGLSRAYLTRHRQAILSRCG